MSPTTLSRLGLEPGTRAVVLHADDIGMCHSTIAAAVELFACGGISSASLMAPCPWAREAAETLTEAGARDLGAHWTLTSEWRSYRWQALTADASLRDDQGRLPHRTEQIQAQASTEAVAVELAAQLEALQSWGVPLSHADTHMGSLLDARLLPVAMQVGAAHGVWPLSLRLRTDHWLLQSMDPAAAAKLIELTEQLETEGWPMIDHIVGLPTDVVDGQLQIAEQALREVQPGITHFLFHPSLDTAEARSASPDWAGRVANFNAMRDPRIAQVIDEEDLVVLDYGQLQALMPQASGDQAPGGVES